MAADSLAVLLRVFRRETGSWTMYMADSWAWTDRAGAETRDFVQSMIAEERGWIERLADLIDERGGVPRPGAFATEYTDSHFLSLQFLLRRLIGYQQRSVPLLEADLNAVVSDPPARRLLANMLEHQRGRLATLERIASGSNARA